MADLIGMTYERAIPQYVRGRLLDLGCGRVPLYATYRDLVNDNVCVDWGSTLHPNPHLDLEHDLTQSLPFGDKEFDTILLSDVLEHIPTPEALWDEMVRILRPGGHILLNVPFLYRVHEQPHDYYRYTEYCLRRFAEKRDLTVLELLPLGGSLDVLTDLITKNLAAIPVVGNWGATMVYWISSLVLSTPVGTMSRRATSSRFPYLYFMVAQRSAV